MNELNRLLTQASAELDLSRMPESGAVLQERVVARIRRRQTARLFGASALVLALVMGAGLAWSVRQPSAQNEQASSGDPALLQTLNDGSRIQRSGASKLRVVQQTQELVRIELAQGSARFEVTAKPGRRFVVQVETLEVEVVGTVFEVKREAHSAEVRVHEGLVRVRHPAQTITLSAGKAQRFALGGSVATDVTDSGSTPPLSLPPSDEPRSRTPRGVASADGVGEHGGDWRGLARAGKFTQAYAAMPSAATTPSSTSVDELLLRADVARLSGHPAEAVEPLLALLSRHPGDSRAPSASFTLGRVYEQLGRSTEAASSFAKARALQPSGPLAEDALARETLALLAGGAKAQGEARGRQYLARYPQGVRAQEIRARTGLP